MGFGPSRMHECMHCPCSCIPWCPGLEPASAQTSDVLAIKRLIGVLYLEYVLASMSDSESEDVFGQYTLTVYGVANLPAGSVKIHAPLDRQDTPDEQLHSLAIVVSGLISKACPTLQLSHNV